MTDGKQICVEVNVFGKVSVVRILLAVKLFKVNVIFIPYLCSRYMEWFINTLVLVVFYGYWVPLPFLRTALNA